MYSVISGSNCKSPEVHSAMIGCSRTPFCRLIQVKRVEEDFVSSPSVFFFFLQFLLQFCNCTVPLWHTGSSCPPFLCVWNKVSRHSLGDPLSFFRCPFTTGLDISLDYITGLTPLEGNLTILTVVDRFSEMVHSVALLSCPFQCSYSYQLPLCPVLEGEVSVPSAQALIRRCHRIWYGARLVSCLA